MQRGDRDASARTARRSSSRPITYRFRGHSMADPEEYRDKEQVKEWRKRDPIKNFAAKLDDDDLDKLDEAADAAHRRGRRVRRRVRLPRRPSRSTTTSTCSATRSRAGTRSTSAPPACTRARTSARWRLRRAAVRAGRRAVRGGGRRARRRTPTRPRRARTMAELRYREALNAALREEMERDERVLIMGEDIGVFNGAFKVTQGLLEEFGEKRVRDTPISENTIVGVGVGRRDDRAAAGRGADDGQLLAAGDGPDRQPHGDDPLHVRRPGDGADGGADAAGRRPPARADALALPGGDLPARAGDAARRAVDARRREGPAEGRDPRRQPGRLHRARVALRAPRARSPTTRTTSSTSGRPRSGARAPTSRSSGSPGWR